MGKPVIIGLRNLVYAKLVTDPDTGGTATYQAPVAVPGAISAKVNTNGSAGTLFADDGPFEVATAIGDITLELNTADLTLEQQADLLGHSMNGAVLMRKAGDVAPWVAIGYKSLKSNGHYRYTWLTKGKFIVPDQENKSKEDKVNFSTPTIQGHFVRRDCDDEWQRHVDEDSTNYTASLGTNWFNDPYGNLSNTTPPTISSVVPANNATAVAATSSVVWTFSEALALTSVTKANFAVVKDTDGSNVAGTLSINAPRTVVTFTPSANLAAATAYRAIVTTGVADLAGNLLANPSVTKFTTA